MARPASPRYEQPRLVLAVQGSLPDRERPPSTTSRKDVAVYMESRCYEQPMRQEPEVLPEPIAHVRHGHESHYNGHLRPKPLIEPSGLPGTVIPHRAQWLVG